MEELATQLLTLVQVNPEAAALVLLAALCVGQLLKSTPKVPNYVIPWTTAALGIGGGLVFISTDPKGAVIGFALGLFSNGIQSFIKNGVLRRTSDNTDDTGSAGGTV